MKTKLRHWAILLALFLPVVSLPARAGAQEGQRGERARSRPQYEIKLTIHFLTDGKRVSHKDYSIMLRDDSEGKIRALKKIPAGSQAGKNEYREIGVKCDTKVEMKDGLLDVEMELVMANPSSSTEGATGSSPIDEVQCHFEANILPGTPSVVARLDAPDSNAGYEIEVLAVPVTVRQ